MRAYRAGVAVPAVLALLVSVVPVRAGSVPVPADTALGRAKAGTIVGSGAATSRDRRHRPPESSPPSMPAPTTPAR
jgi:hypothetical protein